MSTKKGGKSTSSYRLVRKELDQAGSISKHARQETIGCRSGSVLPAYKCSNSWTKRACDRSVCSHELNKISHSYTVNVICTVECLSEGNKILQASVFCSSNFTKQGE
jgi:hypothetical protein